MAWDFSIYVFNPKEATARLRAYFQEEGLFLEASFFLSSHHRLIEAENKLWDEKRLSTEELYQKLNFQEMIYFRSRPFNDAVYQVMMNYLEKDFEMPQIQDGSVILSQEESLSLVAELCEISKAIQHNMFDHSSSTLSKEEQEMIGIYLPEFEHWKKLIEASKMEKFLWMHSF